MTTVTSVATDMSGALCTADNAAADPSCVVGTPLRSACTFTVTCTDNEDPVLTSCPNVEAGCAADNQEFATLYT